MRLTTRLVGEGSDVSAWWSVLWCWAEGIPCSPVEGTKATRWRWRASQPPQPLGRLQEAKAEVQQHNNTAARHSIHGSTPSDNAAALVTHCTCAVVCEDLSSVVASGWFSLRALLSSPFSTSSPSTASAPVGGQRPSRGQHSSGAIVITDGDEDFDSDDAAFQRAIQASLQPQSGKAEEDDEVLEEDTEDAELRRALALSLAGNTHTTSFDSTR